jgi:uncharacterized oxidoreductase
LVIARAGPRLDALSKEFPDIVTFAADLSNTVEYERVADQVIRKYPRLHLLINNAAVQNTPTYLDDDFTYESISHEINVNFTAVCALSYLLLPALLQDSNDTVIANINSGLALAPKTNAAIYCASKAAMNTLSRSLSYQLEYECACDAGFFTSC